MITQIMWLVCLPFLIFISYKLIAFVYKQLDKDHNTLH